MIEQRELAEIYKSIEPYIRLGQNGVTANMHYEVALKAALAKTFDFNAYVSSVESSSHSFYHTATLRGICEDIIVLKAFLAFPAKDRFELIAQTQMTGVYESLKSQYAFFKANRPGQPVLGNKDAEKAEKTEKDKLLKLYGRLGFINLKGKPFIPSVRALAKKAGLLDVYDFFYSATSKWVHFSPQILMRMGWAPDANPSSTFTFSTASFSNYYAGFNAVFGAYLFALFYDCFATELRIDPMVGTYVAELRAYLNDLTRWPEVVTFEEMNIERPNMIFYAAMKLVAEQEAEKLKQGAINNAPIPDVADNSE